MSSRRTAPGGRAKGDGGPVVPGDVALRRHLESEDPYTDSPELAQSWVRTYAELVEFEERVLARLQDLMPALSVDARHEAEFTNLPMIVQHLQTFRYRLAHWRQRLRELDGH